MWSLLRRELYMSILLTSAENEQISLFCLFEEWLREFWFIGGRYTWVLVSRRNVHVNFGLLEEGTREFWFIGGRYMWVLVYWRKVHVSFGLMEEDTREFWFIGGRYTWGLVCWRKIHVNIVYWRKRHMKFADDSYGSWNGHHWCVCTDSLASIFTEYTPLVYFLRVVFRIQWPSQMRRHSRVKADYVRTYNYRYPR